MTDAFATVNWLSVVVAAAAALALGCIWYSRILFGNAWVEEIGLTDDTIANASTGKLFAGTFVMQFCAASALAIWLGAGSDWRHGLHAGLVISLTWVGTAFGTTYLFEQRSLRLYLINTGYNLLAFVTMGIILGSWP